MRDYRDHPPNGLRLLRSRLYRESLARARKCAEDFELASLDLGMALHARVVDTKDVSNGRSVMDECVEARMWDSEKQSSPYSTVCDPEDEFCEDCEAALATRGVDHCDECADYLARTGV